MASKYLSRRFFVMAFSRNPSLAKKYKKNYKNILDSLEKFSELKEPLFEGMRFQLTLVIGDIATLTKNKDIKESNVAKDFEVLVKEAKKEIKLIQTKEKAYEKTGEGLGLKEIDIQIFGQSWTKAALDNYIVEIALPSKPREVIAKKKMSRGKVVFRGLMANPAGRIWVQMTPEKASRYKSSHRGQYKIRGKKMVIDAKVLKSSPISVKASSLTEARKKVGYSAGLSAVFKIVSVDGKASSEREIKNVEGVQVEWKFEVPSGGLELKIK